MYVCVSVCECGHMHDTSRVILHPLPHTRLGSLVGHCAPQASWPMNFLVFSFLPSILQYEHWDCALQHPALGMFWVHTLRSTHLCGKCFAH